MTYTCFNGDRRLATGTLEIVAIALKKARSKDTTAALLVFDDSTGRTTDIDTRGSDEEIRARLQPTALPAESRGRGRPKLGVLAKEVTLLPRHWEWLAAQQGGASVALRKLVEDARRATTQPTGNEKEQIRKAHERAYNFMSAIAGNLPNYEEALRALFANDKSNFSHLISAWPVDVHDHAVQLGFGQEQG